jgi:predicted dehydrogenase
MNRQTLPGIAVVGAGLIGRVHIEQVVSEARLSGIVDPDPAARDIADRHAVPVYATLQELIDHNNTEGVIIATPTEMHVEQAYVCIEAGLPTLVEKPISDSVVAAERMLIAAEKVSVPIMIGHHRRYNPIVQKARDLILEGRIGQVVAVHVMCWLKKPGSYFDTAWRQASAAGPMLTNLIHDIDLLRYIIGEVVSVQASESRMTAGRQMEDTATLMLQFDNGVLGTMTLSDTVASPWSWELTAGENAAYPQTDASCYLIGGTRGSLSMPDLGLWRNPGKAGWHEPIIKESMACDSNDPLALQIRHFCDVIRGRSEPLVSGREGLRTLRVVTAAKEAARRGKRVTILR